MFKLPRACGLTVAALFGSAAGTTHAHFPWVVPVSGAEDGLAAQVMFGHGPEDARVLDAERIAELHWLDAAGRAQALAPDPQDQWQVPAAPASGGMLAGLQTPGFWSRTPEGGQRQSRATLDNVSHCSHSHNGFKALLGEGDDFQSGWGEPVGHPLEVVPSASKATPLAVRLQLRGAPAEGPLTVTSIGDGRVQEITVDRVGTTVVPLTGSGPWLLHSEHREDYGDPAVCDERSFHATLYVNAF
ncbi:MAG: DUF4198 domain-containing protein [Algiphilus sp.]